MSLRQPDFDIDLAIGAQSELWVSDLRSALRENGRVEVKAPKPFLREQSFYVEYECRGRDGIWRPSGIMTSKSELFFFTFGSLPGCLVIERRWLLAAVELAKRNPDLFRECKRGSNPTRAVIISLSELYQTRPGEP